MNKNLIAEGQDIRNFLHFYIGCDYQWQDESGEWRRPQKLNSYQFNDVIKHHINSRLILRPLESMTETEMKELYFLVWKREFIGDNITHRDVGSKEERWCLWSGLERLMIYKDGDVAGDCDLHYVRVHTPTVFAWQLSKGFDLFGLIKAGFAIDSTKRGGGN